MEKKEFKQNPGNTAICYYRYSSDAQRGCSIDQQKQAAHEYAERMGFTIIKEYEEPAISGTRSDRPQYQLMLYEVEQLRPAHLIIWKTDRLSRDKIELVLAKKRLRECGVGIDYVAEVVPDDEATQLLIESIYEAMAASYSINLRKNVMRGLNYNAERALYNGNLILGYKGETDKPYVVDEAAAEIVRLIFREYADGKPKQHICDDLNRKGIKTVRDNDFTINSISHILSNDAYIGVYKWGDYRIEGGMPRIIDDELFEKVQKKIEANRRGGKGAVKKLNPDSEIADYLLTGKLYCKECGSPMTGLSGTGKCGDLFYYYSCTGHRKRKCAMKNKSKELLEKIAHRVLREVLQDGANRIILAEEIYSYYQKQNENEVYLKSLQSKLDEVNKKLANIMKAIEKGAFNDTTASRMNELEAQKNALAEEISAEKNKQKYKLTLERIVRFFDNYVDGISTPEKFKKVLDFFVNKIYLTEDDRMIFTFYYSDDKREIDIDDMAEYINILERINEMMNIPNDSDLFQKKKSRKKAVNDSGGAPYFFH